MQARLNRLSGGVLPFLLLASCAGAPAASSGATGPSVRALLEVRAPANPVLAPDGALYVRDWPEGVNQVFRVDRDGRRVQLSNFEDGASGFSLSPDGERLLVRAASGGNEQDQVFLLGATREGGGSSALEPLLTRARTVFRPQVWLADGSGFLYAANDESAEAFHLYRFDFEARGSASGRATKLLARPGSWSVQDVTGDARRALVSEFVSESDVRAYELELESGVLRPLGPQPEAGGTLNTAGIAYWPNERAVLLESDVGDGIRRVWRQDLRSGALERPLPQLDAHEIDGSALNESRSLLALVTNEQGYGVLHVYRLPEFEEVELPAMERGVVVLGEWRERSLSLTLSSPRSPGLAFALDVPERGAARLRALTEAVAEGVDLAQLVEPELVRYRSFDGLEIPAFLYRPRGAQGPLPFVVNFHGGPEGQHRPAFNAAVQALVARGFGVLQPNVRGSTGYGREFHRLDDVRRRWDSVRDGVEAARWLVKEGLSETGRIAAYGGSYGGFMAVATVIEGAEVFGAGVDVVGIVNFETFLEQTAGYRRALREAEYGALSDREFLRSISPLARAAEIRCPMLIAHGLNDPRVPVGEAMQLAVTLQSRGMDPELYFFPDEGHGFAKLENRALFTERMVRFLERTIGPAR